MDQRNKSKSWHNVNSLEVTQAGKCNTFIDQVKTPKLKLQYDISTRYKYTVA